MVTHGINVLLYAMHNTFVFDECADLLFYDVLAKHTKTRILQYMLHHPDTSPIRVERAPSVWRNSTWNKDAVRCSDHGTFSTTFPPTSNDEKKTRSKDEKKTPNYVNMNDVAVVWMYVGGVDEYEQKGHYGTLVYMPQLQTSFSMLKSLYNLESWIALHPLSDSAYNEYFTTSAVTVLLPSKVRQVFTVGDLIEWTDKVSSIWPINSHVNVE
jgi:hypothetical protein